MAIAYDPARLPNCRQTWRGAQVWDIEAFVRVHPRGEVAVGSVLKARRQPPDTGMVVGRDPAPLEFEVPPDTTQLELWFHNFAVTSGRCDAWDSRFGQNYWFEVGGPPPRSPRDPVALRSEATARPDVVSVVRRDIVKRNVFPAGPTGRVGTDLQTLVSVVVRVENLAYVKNVWMDVHVFDRSDERIHGQTFTLGYTGSAGGAGDLFAFDGRVYQGTVATPGSVSPRPDAGTVQYRVYYEVLGRVFTDGVLHQQSLTADAVTR